MAPGRFFKNGHRRFVLFYVAFATHFEFGAPVSLQVFIKRVVLLCNAQFCFDPGLSFTLGAEGIFGIGKLFFDLLPLFGCNAGAFIAATAFMEQGLQATLMILAFPLFKRRGADAKLCAKRAHARQ